MPPESHWTDSYGIRVRQWGNGWKDPWRGYIYALGVAWTLFRERHNYQTAYFLMQGLQLATGLPVARLLGKSIVMKFSGSSLVRGMATSWTGRLELAMLERWAGKILVLNEGMLEEVREVGLSTERVGFMPNPVDTDEFQPVDSAGRAALRQQLGVPAEAPLGIFVGRLDVPKELPCLVGAWAQVVRARPDARLILIGAGPHQAMLEQQARGLGITANITFTGRLPIPDVIRWLQAGDIFTLVSSLEGLPCSVIEAMAVGLPCVVSDIPAHHDLVDPEVHGLRPELGDETAIAQSFLRLIEDPALRKRMGQAGRQRVLERYATSKVADEYETLFEQIQTGGR